MRSRLYFPGTPAASQADILRRQPADLEGRIPRLPGEPDRERIGSAIDGEQELIAPPLAGLIVSSGASKSRLR
jgi:hypothetical protein